MENKDKAAFPLSGERWQQDIGRGVASSEYQGLTKREYFAAIAMQGLMAVNDKGSFESTEHAIQEGIKRAIMVADELLKQLEK